MEADTDDPFNWSVDRVVNELCHKATLPGQEGQATARPDPRELERTLRNNDVGGQVLLENVDKHVLQDDLRIRSLGQRSALERAIKFLRSRSVRWSTNNGVDLLQTPEDYRPITPSSYLYRPSFSPRTSVGYPQHRSPLHAYPPLDLTAISGDRDRRPTVPLFHSTNQAFGEPDSSANRVLPKSDLSSSRHDLNEDSRAHFQRTHNEVSTETIPAERHQTSIGQDGFDTSIVPSIEHAETNVGDEEPRPQAHAENIQPSHIMTRNGKKRRIAPKLISTITSNHVNDSDRFHTDSILASLQSQAVAMDIQDEATANERCSRRYYGEAGINLENIFYGPHPVDDSSTWTVVGDFDNYGTRQWVGELVKHFLQQPVESIQDTMAKARVPYTASRIHDLLPKHHRRQMFTMFDALDDPISLNAAKFPGLRSRGFGPYGRKARNVSNAVRFLDAPLLDPNVVRNVTDVDELDLLLAKYPPKPENDDIAISRGQSVGSLDEETWKEHQEEKAEKASSVKTLLSIDTVNSAIDDRISAMVSTWQEYKLPKMAKKVYLLWHKAKTHGDRAMKIDEAEERLRHIERSLAKMRKEIVSHEWSKVDGVQNLCWALEEFVSQREEQRQIVAGLSNNRAPPKPEPPPIARKKVPIVDLDDGVEVLESDSASSQEDDKLGDFIQDDLINVSPRDNTPLEYSDTSAENSQVKTGIGTAKKDGEVKITREIEDNVSHAFADDEMKVDRRPKDRKNGPVVSPFDRSPISKKKKHLPFLQSSTEESEQTDGEVSPSELSHVNKRPNRTSERESFDPDLDTKKPQSSRSRYALKGHDKNDPIALSSDGPESSGDTKGIRTPRLHPTSATKRRAKSIRQPSGSLDSDNQLNKQARFFPNPKYVGDHLKLLELAEQRRGEQSEELNDVTEGLSKDLDVCSELQDITKVRSMSLKTLKANNDHKGLLGKLIYETNQSMLGKLYAFVNGNDQHYLGVILEQGLRELYGDASYIRGEKKYKIAMTLCTYYASYANCRDVVVTPSALKPLPRRIWQTALQPDDYTVFFNVLRTVLGTAMASNSSEKKSKELGSKHDNYDKTETSEVEDTTGHSSRSFADVEDSIDDPEFLDITQTPHKKRAREVADSQEALAAQRSDKDRMKRQEMQRKRIHLQTAAIKNANDKASLHIIGYRDPPVYLDSYIGHRVKPHQVKGISFLWREIIGDEKRQGCLLAHTMGLGKTMQVISLLVTIALSKQNPDAMIREQVESIPNLRTLVLCPPSLIDNWLDEFGMWVPEHADEALGHWQEISSSIERGERLRRIDQWYQDGGVLIIGYEMIRDLITNRVKKGNTLLTHEQHERVKEKLLEGPSIVVADEAHKMKNDSSSLSQVTSKFTTASRIALTGSPLANNLEDYYAMINWIAPGYLGNPVQFRAKYKEPIEEGLYAESSRYEQRKGLKRLQILKEDLEAKVCRADISVIKQDLPQKSEFFITFSLTKIQKRAYELYVKSVLTNADHVEDARFWGWLALLSLLCNHPSCFRRKIADRGSDKARASNRRKGASTDDPEDVSLPVDVSVKKLGLSDAMMEEQLNIFKNQNDIDDPALSARTDVLLRLVDACLQVNDKVLIFSHSIPTLDYLENLLKSEKRDLCRLDGSTKMATRQAITKQFNQDNEQYNVFLISTRAGGLGLNLPGANRVIIFDFGFNPQWEEQAIGRAYRLGQTKPVFVYRFCSAGTFESIMKNKTIFKTQLSARVVDNKNLMRSASKNPADYLFIPKKVPREDLSEAKGKDPDVLDRLLSHEAIVSVDLTETFQMEVEETLTAEERKEVQQEIKDEKLKRKDSIAFEATTTRRTAARAIVSPQKVDQHVHSTSAAASVMDYQFQKYLAPKHLGAKPTPEGTFHHFPHPPHKRQPSPPSENARGETLPYRASSQAPGPTPAVGSDPT